MVQLKDNLHDNKTTIFWIGDVKIIHLRNNQIKFETEDYSINNHLKRKGNISGSLNLDFS